MRPLLLLSVLCLPACTPSYTSYVGPIDARFAPKIADEMAAFVGQRVRPDGGSLCIDGPANDTTVAPFLAPALQDLGFRIVASACRHRVRYAASTLGGDVMIRVSVDNADGARLYRDKVQTGLAPLGPFSVTETGG
jgi:hypothetical protein